MQKQTKEIWMPVVGYEGFYCVSNLGKVKSLDRYVGTNGGSKRLCRGKMLNRIPDQDGYHRIQLYKNGKYVNKYVHNLVMDAFVGPCMPGHHVMHLEHVSVNRDDSLSNLRYGSASCNMAFKHDDGTTNCGERSPLSKLTEKDVISIRRAYFKEGKTQTELAPLYNVGRTTISAVCRRQNWDHVE